MQKAINIAIDGYSACGKSTLARQLAIKLGYIYVDSGAMYRAIALALQEHNFPIEKSSEQTLKSAILPFEVGFDLNKERQQSEVMLNNKPVENFIRTVAIGQLASKISQYKVVRDKLHTVQRSLIKQKGVVMDGRDIGTVVMPDAELKIFMTASQEVRAKRRLLELQAKGYNYSLQEVLQMQAKRDRQDTERTNDPLQKAKDAILLDNSHLNEAQQLRLALNWAKNSGKQLT